MSKKKWFIIGGIILSVALIATITTIALVRYYSMHGTCGNNLTWVYDGKGTLTISGTGKMYDYDYFDNRPPWHKFLHSEIDTIIIESGVQNIGDEAFYWWYSDQAESNASLQEVYIANSVTQIGSSSFYGCDNLSTIKIPESVTKIGSYAFSYCLSLEQIILPQSITTIASGAFSHCSSLKQINLPQSITTIDCFAFEGCQSLDNVYLPQKIKIIEQDLFSGCSSLSKIDIPDSVIEIKSGAFANCTNLSEIRFHGASPEISEGWEDRIEGAFHNVTATAYYPSEQWYGFTPKGFGGNIDWYPS